MSRSDPVSLSSLSIWLRLTVARTHSLCGSERSAYRTCQRRHPPSTVRHVGRDNKPLSMASNIKTMRLK